MTAHWSLYLVQAHDGTIYTGITTDVVRRLQQHNSGKGSRFLRSRLPAELAFECMIGDRALASKAEYRVKQWSRAQKQALISKPLASEALLAALELSDE